LLGIIFTGGEGPQAHFVKQLFNTESSNLYFENALFVAADSGLAAAENAGLKPGWIVGDMDSLDTQARLAAYPPERVIRHKHDKDFTDTELALSLAMEKGCKQIWIIGGGGGRIDHLFAIRALFERENFPRRWITGSEDIFCIDAQNSNIGFTEQEKGCLTVNCKQGAVVSVFPLGVGPWEAKSSGLKWQLEGLEWTRGFFGLSNVAVDEKFSIKADKGRFMVISPISAGRY
jgi:thiamine pyrophosphokinase